MSYAEHTKVPISKSRAEIEALIMKCGGSAFASGWSGNIATVQFVAQDRLVRFTLRLPDPSELRFTRKHGGKYDALTTVAVRTQRYEQETRRLWRALLLSIKAKLECVDSKIETFEEAFLAHIVLPSGGTVGASAIPQIAESYKNTGAPRPLLLTSGD